jgi:hypothetical protein
MNKDLEIEVQKMINEGASEETIGVFIANSTKKNHSEPFRADNNSNNNSVTTSKSEYKKLSTTRVDGKLFKFFPFAFDIALVILFGNLISSFIRAKDVDYDYYDEIFIAFCTMFCMIILAKWYWNYKGKKTGIIVKNYVFYLLLFSALLFGMFYISLLAE